ncbi:hypothetical protein Clacol_000077 [Clathrus columnatus]|uniref:Uncharacterized protein n=1 Tax=Clathrus columnatus TaxID=1419009 RepID=A0AAV5A1X3_9AGAM|nr:hypothetical protein Clacol_000077 [Clathrus columnatus]
MAISIFTDDQREWLQSFTKQYECHLGKRRPGNGTRFAHERAEEFVKKWSSLADGRIINREDMIRKVLTWFRNCPKSTARRRASIRAPNRKEGRTNIRKLNNKNEPDRHGRRTRRNNQRLSTMKRKGKGGELSSEEEEVTMRDSPDRLSFSLYEPLQNTLQQDASVERSSLLQELESVLQSHTENTRSASYYFLLAHPPTEPNNPPVLSRLQSSSITDFPDFGSYFQADEEHIYRKWKEYATAVERKHIFGQKLKLITLDRNGYPKVPVMRYDLKELGEALTVYLEQTWYKLHEHMEDITVITIPWSDVELNSAQYLQTSALPPSLIPFQAPNRTSAAKIVQLHSFLEDNADKPFSERFPFIIQSKIPAQSKRPMVIMVNNNTRSHGIAQN